MPDFIVLREAPPTITAASAKAAITQALAGMDDYAEADGSFTVAFWVGPASGEMVDVTVTVDNRRTITVDLAP
jgi:hypothetical protein